jgi:1-acyl-sn-glycerol-3-phosphate acyltransferase
MLERLRALVTLGVWAAGLAVLGPPCILLTVVTKWEGFITYPTTAVVRLGLLLGGARFTVAGRERLDARGVYVYTPNHQSLLDPPLVWISLGSPARRPAFLVKKEIGRVPVLGYGIRQIGMLLVDRSNTERARASALEATERLHAGRSFAVFPEGTRTRDGRLLPFKKGAFYMAVDAGVPIVPVSIDGAHLAMPRGQMRLRRVPIRITIHEPIPTAGLSQADVPRLLEEARAAVASAVAEEALVEGGRKALG